MENNSIKASKIIKYINIILICLFLNSINANTLMSSGVLQEKGLANFYEIYSIKAISNVKILPDTSPIPGSSSQEINITACRGQFEPASFVVRSAQKIFGLRVAATDLKGEHSLIHAGAIDIRVVKCWFQAGGLLHVPGPRQYLLTPELILKDDKLVSVNLEKKENYLRVNGLGSKNYILISGPTRTWSG